MLPTRQHEEQMLVPDTTEAFNTLWLRPGLAMDES